MSTSFDSFITFFRTADLEATHVFYHDVLGLSCVLNQGRCRIYRVSKAGYVCFCTHLTGLDDADRSSVIITLVADDVDDWFEKLTSRAIETDGKPRMNQEFRIYHFFATDPSGYRVEIQRFENPHWAGP